MDVNRISAVRTGRAVVGELRDGVTRAGSVAILVLLWKTKGIEAKFRVMKWDVLFGQRWMKQSETWPRGRIDRQWAEQDRENVLNINFLRLDPWDKTIQMASLPLDKGKYLTGSCGRIWGHYWANEFTIRPNGTLVLNTRGRKEKSIPRLIGWQSAHQTTTNERLYLTLEEDTQYWKIWKTLRLVRLTWSISSSSCDQTSWSESFW